MITHNLPQTKLSIPLPPNWAPPKYQFGQLTQQGWIIGMRFYPEYSALGYSYRNSGWQYEVIRSWLETDTEIISESSVRLYEDEEAKAELQAEINLLQRQIEDIAHAL
ncbi:hypothetical protein [Iningainema tapete]|uniref:Uncharacterized protein n=1 Tax=Iningainema tapete BLCC-T55 TaxID=2748662 RepID=A0A8J7C4B0_9CYAN|nr:hypothetical protein [Iningainema tapete]MBD2771209.1 hypothetical protein [Iningainema tapete BLCC-T55]